MMEELLPRHRAEITVFSPMLPPTKYVLMEALATVGRSPDCTVPIRDRYLSRRHAEFLHEEGSWVLRDCGSANGTFVNGTRIEGLSRLRSGDRVRLGDTEILFLFDQTTDRFLAIPESRTRPTIAIPFSDITAEQEVDIDLGRFRILNSMAMELIEEQPLDQLFGFILDRMMEHLHPSRAAIGILADDGRSFSNVEVRRKDPDDTSDLAISKTLLAEVVEEKKALAFVDVSVDEKLSRAHSIIMQGIHSVICAPLLAGDSVMGVLYVDYLFTQKSLSEDDVRLLGQIARIAAVKVENTRLREAAIQKRILDEELKTAYIIQKRLLPETPPAIDGYSFEGVNRPCRTVSGDYYDFIVRPDGSIYFVIADVSGKGVTAALLMACLQASFRIFAGSDPAPGELVARLNSALRENMPQARFITLFAGRLHPESGRVEYTNAGHTPPYWLHAGEPRIVSDAHLLLGMFPDPGYQTAELTLEKGDALVLFTDGVSEADDASGAEFGDSRFAEVLSALHGERAEEIVEQIELAVMRFIGERPVADDLTVLVIGKNA
ncbi:MAG: SpoIIE family protein phosphatase [Thermoanaerobaculia bacterium]